MALALLVHGCSLLGIGAMELVMQFRVWGFVDGKQFDQVFNSVAEWRAERRVIERCYAVEVRGMASI